MAFEITHPFLRHGWAAHLCTFPLPITSSTSLSGSSASESLRSGCDVHEAVNQV